MRNEEKNKWKQKSSNLPLGIKAKVGLAVKVGAVALGFHVWGIDFIWVVLGFTFCYDILRGIFSCIIRKSKCSTDFKRNDFLKKNEAYPLGALRSLKFAYRKLRISLFVELAV